MEGIEGTINDLMVHPQFDSNAHMPVAQGSSCCPQSAGGDSALLSDTQVERGREQLPGSLRPGKAHTDPGGHRGHVFLFCLAEKHTQSNRHFRERPWPPGGELLASLCVLWPAVNQPAGLQSKPKPAGKEKLDKDPAPFICCPCLINEHREQVCFLNPDKATSWSWVTRVRTISGVGFLLDNHFNSYLCPTFI